MINTKNSGSKKPQRKGPPAVSSSHKSPALAKGVKNKPSSPVKGKGRRGVVKQFIPNERFVSKAKERKTKETPIQHSFADFKLHPQLERNIAAKGYIDPSPIQDQTVIPGIEGRDIVGLANTGTGKTAAFLLPLIQKLLENPLSKALIMAPTRELAKQIEDEFISLSIHFQLKSALLIGGTNINPQTRKLAAKPRLIIGTPGRIRDHVNQGALKLGGFNFLVLDEVDRMLDMGFIRDIQDLLRRLPEDRQSFFFSATMDKTISALLEKYSKNALYVNVLQGETSDAVDQNIVLYESLEEKIDLLHTLLIDHPEERILIFEDTKHQVEQLGKELKARGFGADSLHGNKSQAQRQRALNDFKKGKNSILVATDVAARGIDVPDISYVINYSAPCTWADYIHRIGRAGRAGKAGKALTFLPKLNQANLVR